MDLCVDLKKTMCRKTIVIRCVFLRELRQIGRYSFMWEGKLLELGEFSLC